MNIQSVVSYLKAYNFQLRRLIKKKIILEMHAADHCNLNCLSCSHFSSIAHPKFCDLTILEKSLDVLKNFSDQFEVIHILGGEPLLFPELSRMMALTRKAFPDNNIKVITNGILLTTPEKLPANFFETCREEKIKIEITCYPINLDYDQIKAFCSSKDVECEIQRFGGSSKSIWTKRLFSEKGGDCFEFKFRLFKPMKCQKRCFQIVGDKLYGCNATAYIPYVNKQFSSKFKIGPKDYIEIKKLKNSWQLKKLMLFGTPFCRYCSIPKATVWGKTRKESSEWINSKQ